jgi:D-beta-D-heptose 7-phosphate kinase / D-beta-D-heptose 1-phosphate adenosyltransferase
MNAYKDKSPRILVIGDLIIDKYLWGVSERISPEAPVQIIDINKETTLLGGAGNVVNNLKQLGAEVDVISVIGNCEISIELTKLLKNINVQTKYLIKQKNRICSKKTRIIASQQQVVRYDRESSDDIDSQSINTIIKIFSSLILDYEIILLSDYGKGVLTNQLTQSLIRIANKNNKKVIIDPKGFNYEKYSDAYLLTPNKKEAGQATKISIIDNDSLEKAIKKLKLNCNISVSLITLSEDGIAIFDKTLRIFPTISQEVFDVTGAGDTVLASLGFSLACNLDLDEAVKFSNLAAGVVVGKIGSATASLSEIAEYEAKINKSSSIQNIKSFEEITLLSSELKSNNKKIVFTNGCFDLIHSGHISYLESTKNYGDVLIVGLNSNKSVEALKGPNRPINDQGDRAYILASLEAVDYVVIFDEETPYKLIKMIRPDILVKGGDYEKHEVVGHDIVDEVRIVNFIDGKSSTKTIQQIKNGVSYAINHKK